MKTKITRKIIINLLVKLCGYKAEDLEYYTTDELWIMLIELEYKTGENIIQEAVRTYC